MALSGGHITANSPNMSRSSVPESPFCPFSTPGPPENPAPGNCRRTLPVDYK